MGFARYESGRRKEGWLVNVQPTAIEDDRLPAGRAALDCYFIEQDGSTFKATVEYNPYFLIAVKRGHESEVEEWVKRIAGGGVVKSIQRVEKDDLSMPNHLLGYRRTYLQLNFANVNDLLAARRDIMPIAEKNKKNMSAMDAYAEVATANGNGNFDLFDDAQDDQQHNANSYSDASDYIVDLREYDVPYHVRVMIDLGMKPRNSRARQNLRLVRYSSRKMVFCRGKAWHHEDPTQPRQIAPGRPCCPCIRYRNHENAPQIS